MTYDGPLLVDLDERFGGDARWTWAAHQPGSAGCVMKAIILSGGMSKSSSAGLPARDYVNLGDVGIAVGGTASGQNLDTLDTFGAGAQGHEGGVDHRCRTTHDGHPVARAT